MDKKIKKMLDEQIALEIHSSHLYLAMQSWFADEGYDGYAHWYYIQAQEELDHSKIIYNVMLELGERPEVLEIEKPDQDFKDVEDILEKTLEHEKFITASINKIYDAVKEDDNDYRLYEMLNWFVAEQVEEEDNTSGNLDRYKLFGSDARGLLGLDQEMGGRVYGKPQYLLDLEGGILSGAAN